jgi:hypothetical protein
VIAQQLNFYVQESEELSKTDTKILHDCVTLVRNILHIPEDVPTKAFSERGNNEEFTVTSDLDENQVSFI